MVHLYAVGSPQEDKFYKALGRRIRVAREHEGLSQEALADHLGVCQSTVSHYERGVRKLSPWQLWRVSQLVGAKIDELTNSRSLRPRGSGEPKRSKRSVI